MKSIVLREVIGQTLRELRGDAGMTLRQVSTASVVSLGYLSEIERGHKEASSEVLASVCKALDVSLSELLGLVAVKVSTAEMAQGGVAIAA
ncbi:MAG: helix-turn-helix transcriptional regulator [Propionibacteriaceae bacterium]|nr:helix-turn-helix transcriptional regulator [Propionibacteriaceae bacterium]